MQPEFEHNPAPVAIGGVGGSGTGVVAQLIADMGYFIGETLNRSNDNLTFVKSRDLLAIADPALRRQSIAAELHQFEQRMYSGFMAHGSGLYRNWGWKVPGQFHLLEHTSQYFSQLKYVHVMRHGLDMAFSKNKNQLRNWGPMMGLSSTSPDDPVAALEYWIRANEKAIEMGKTLLGDRLFVLNYDRLCEKPTESVEELVRFVLGTSVSSEEIDRLSQVVKPPAGVHRYRQHNVVALFPADALQRVQDLGFSIQTA